MRRINLIACLVTAASLLAGLAPHGFARGPRNPLMDPLKLALSTTDQARDLETDLYLISRQRPMRRDAGGEKMYWGNRYRREIALTFDDGPHPKYVPEILRILEEHHTHATFFVIGEEADRYPDMVIREAAAGNEVSNHTYHHARLNQVMPEMAGPEIEACDLTLERILKRPADPYFRPPGGEISEALMDTCRRLGKTPVMFTDDPEDFKNIGERLLLDRLLKRAAPGGIILLHDNVKQTLHILPALLTLLERQGYRFVTISQLDADRGLPPDTGLRRAGLPVPGQEAIRTASSAGRQYRLITASRARPVRLK